LKKHFSAAGVIKELYFQSRDSAVVTYADASGASQAVTDLNETTIEGQKRYVIVKLDDPDREGKGEGKKKGKAKGEGKSSSKTGKGGSGATGRTIFVKGFDFDTDAAALQKHFGKMGAIEELHFQSKWAAVITFVKEVSAQKALAQLEGTTIEYQSHYLALKLDDPDRKGGKGKGAGNGAKGSTTASGSKRGDGYGRTIFASGFDFDTDDAALEWHFGTMGAIEDYHFQSKGSAVITFVKAVAAQRALTQLDGSTLDGQSRYVDVKLDDPDSRGGKDKGNSKGKGKSKSWGKRK